jgi:hypothetical protein
MRQVVILGRQTHEVETSASHGFFFHPLCLPISVRSSLMTEIKRRTRHQDQLIRVLQIQKGGVLPVVSLNGGLDVSSKINTIFPSCQDINLFTKVHIIHNFFKISQYIGQFDTFQKYQK